MIIVFLFSGLIAGTIAGLVALITGYGILFSALAYSVTGAIAIISTALFHVLLAQVAHWWWARNIDFRFYMIFLQSALIASSGVLAFAYGLTGGGANMIYIGITLLLVSPIWFSIALENILGEPELKMVEDYL